jgi:flagellar basal-body rod modification protein FlgD
VSDTEFIAQMAEFSNLEQTKAMNVEIKELRQSNAFTQAAALMGKQVSLLSGDNTFTKGIVTELEVMEGEVSVIVNGKAYELGQVVKVSSGETEDKNTNE